MKSELIKKYQQPEPKPVIKYKITEEDINIVLKQVQTTKENAKDKLLEFNGDIVKTIINIYSTIPLK